MRKPNRPGTGASIRHTSRMSEVPEPTHRRRAHTSTRDLERYAGLFAERTTVMRSSAMRDLMAITARPEVISLAGGLPDTSTFPPQSFAAQMTRIAQESAAEALHFAAENLDRAYYGTDTRVYQLLAGGLIAITPQLVSRGRRLAVAWAGSVC